MVNMENDLKNNFSKINLPYATKLLFMEIAAMNVNTKFTT